MTVIATSRLVLREFTPDDAVAMCRLNADREMMRDLPVPADNSVSAERARLTTYITGSYGIDGFGIWATVLCETGEIIGRCGLMRQRLDDVDEVEITYQITSSMWGRGLATEVATAIRDHAFGPLGQSRLIALVPVGNVASRRVAEKIGMCRERTINQRGRSFELFVIERET
jgi:RimJ/RimL family protein N-acetyltransferase